MAPEIIELCGVTTKADIWSVACTVIELLTGRPPYFDLEPMSALFRISQDDHPPLPEGTSHVKSIPHSTKNITFLIMNDYNRHVLIGY